MRELVTALEALERRKYGVGGRPRSPVPASPNPAQPPGRPQDGLEEVGQVGQAPPAQNTPRLRGRYVPAAVRREVFERDAARCAYVDTSGQRWRETSCLEIHHLQAFAHGGQHQAVNLALRCRALPSSAELCRALPSSQLARR